MTLKTPDQYIASLNDRPCRIYYEGQQITDIVNHHILKATIDNISETYRLALQEGETALFTETSHLDGSQISRYTHIPRDPTQMVNRIKMERKIANLTGMSNYRSTGADIVICLESITHEVDQMQGSEYHNRFNKYLKKIQEEDLVVGGAVTDTKGDRSLRPSEQPNPDVYVRVVEERTDGIVVRGAKNCQSGAGVFNEIIVLPTRALREEDQDYAISFAVPNDTPGLFHILCKQPGHASRISGSQIDIGNHYAGHETLMIFENVFVPWERVFLYKEWEIIGKAVELFASLHRVCYSGAVVGFLDVVIGAAALMAKMNGVLDSAHIREKLSEMVAMNEAIHACGLASVLEGDYSSSGAYLINPLYANICKLLITRYSYEIFRLAHDIAGGLIVCSPSEKDLKDPDIGEYVRDYLVGAEPFSAEDRIRVARLIEAITFSPLLGVVMHGSGSPQAQKITIMRHKDISEMITLAKQLSGVN